MPLIPLEIPKGVYANGTDLQANMRWLDASLVRWTDGTMRPVKGWQDKGITAIGAAPRGAHAWQDNSGNKWLAVGTFDELQVMDDDNVLYDITPVGFTTGNESGGVNGGYGGSSYGTGFYGTPRAGNILTDATTWSMDTWGENLVACSNDDGTLYEWTLNTGTPAAAISNAPTSCCGLIVTPERFLFALGAGGDPRKVQWSDREDNTAWTPSATNEAGDFILPTNGEIRQAVNVRGQTLILTSTDCWAFTYIGPQLVYSRERIGTSCGAISKNAATVANANAYWMGEGSFYYHAGGAVEEMQCDVADKVFSRLTISQQSKVYAVTNSEFNEVTWFYPVGTECDNYVTYNYRENHWQTGVIDRTAGVDKGVFTYPIWLSSGGTFYDHEIGNNYEGAEVYAETGPISLGVGENVMAVTHFYPDEVSQGNVTATFKTRFYPNDTERTYGPYTMANPTSVRFTGRQIRMRVTGNELVDWRFGVPRLVAAEMGQR